MGKFPTAVKIPRHPLRDAIKGVISEVRNTGVTADYEGEQKENINEFLYKGFMIGAYKIAGNMWKAWAREKRSRIILPSVKYTEFESRLTSMREAVQEVQKYVDYYVKGK